MVHGFKDESVMTSKLIIVVINARGEEEQGIDNGGVFRDILSMFWEEFYNGYTVGEDERVPVIGPHFSKEEWKSVARILVKGFQELQFFPFKLSRIVVATAIHGEDCITRDMLMSSFQAYLAPDERELINAALSCSLGSAQNDEWLDFLDRFKCKRIPKNTKDDVENVLAELAQYELIQVCRYASLHWTPARSLKYLDEFGTLSAINTLYEKVTPTNKRVLKLFTAHPKTTAERETFGFLQRYIRGLSHERLTMFLRFCTGATMLCVDKVRVDFNSDEGMTRRPIAHTCGPSLQLSSTYESYAELREEFNAVLSSGFWDIDIL